MSETKEEIKPVKIRPPIYKFPDSDQTWVQLYELAQILNMRPVDCWETYHSTPYEGRKSENCVSVRFPDSYKLNELAVHMLPWQAEFSAYVPSAWAMSALCGITIDSVVCQRCQKQVELFGSKCPECGSFND